MNMLSFFEIFKEDNENEKNEKVEKYKRMGLKDIIAGLIITAIIFFFILHFFNPWPF